MAGRPDTGWVAFYARVSAYMGDSRSEGYKRASASGNQKQRRRKQGGARPAGIRRIVGPRELGPRDPDLDSRPLEGKFIEADEMSRRRELRKKALEGDEEVLAQWRDGERNRTLVLDGKLLISDGVLVGARLRC